MAIKCKFCDNDNKYKVNVSKATNYVGIVVTNDGEILIGNENNIDELNQKSLSLDIKDKELICLLIHANYKIDDLSVNDFKGISDVNTIYELQGEAKENAEKLCEYLKSISEPQPCKDTVTDYDTVKKSCANGETWDDSPGICKCRKEKTKVVVVYADGCIDPKAFNYYCKTNKCGDDNDTLPENMVPTTCEYRVDDTLEYTYILSNLDDRDPENSVNTWSGDIVISGSSSFDSPDDNSWLTRIYEPWRGYWTKMCSDIGDVNIRLNDEKGLYTNQEDVTIQTDLVKALLKFTSDYGKVSFLKNYKIMVMGDDNSNLGVVSLYKNKLTLNVHDTSGNEHKGLLSYRLNKNNGSIINSRLYPNATTNQFNDYFRKRVNSLQLSVSVDGNYNINVKGLTNEEIIGLGTLLEIKDKPILGLGSLLNI